MNLRDCDQSYEVLKARIARGELKNPPVARITYQPVLKLWAPKDDDREIDAFDSIRRG